MPKPRWKQLHHTYLPQAIITQAVRKRDALTGLSAIHWRPSPHLCNYKHCLTARDKLTHKVKIHKTLPVTSMIWLLKFFLCHYQPFLYCKVVKPAKKTYLFCVERTTSTFHLRLSRHCEDSLWLHVEYSPEKRTSYWLGDSAGRIESISEGWRHGSQGSG